MGLSWLVLAPWPVLAQLTPAQESAFKSVLDSRVEAFTILGGDYGMAGATYTPDSKPDRDVDVNVSKFGGWGDIGDPKPLGDTGIAWQPRLQGSMGLVKAKNDFKAGSVLNGDTSTFNTFAIQFGGGARFWLNDHLSIAPTFMGMYGHSENDYDADSAATQALVPAAKQAGLIEWSADTWTVRPAANVAYVHTGAGPSLR